MRIKLTLSAAVSNVVKPRLKGDAIKNQYIAVISGWVWRS